jgi:hypothetical protein
VTDYEDSLQRSYREMEEQAERICQRREQVRHVGFAVLILLIIGAIRFLSEVTCSTP